MCNYLDVQMLIVQNPLHLTRLLFKMQTSYGWKKIVCVMDNFKTTIYYKVQYITFMLVCLIFMSVLTTCSRFLYFWVGYNSLDSRDISHVHQTLNELIYYLCKIKLIIFVHL